jgi:outer membrane protein, heavy metal efflux system
VQPAAALPDPVLLTELRDFTNEAAGRSPSLIPSQVGSTRYQVSQMLPGWGKRDHRQSAAQAQADEAAARAEVGWNETRRDLSMGWAAYYRLDRTIALSREIRELMARLEAVARHRYGVGLAAQQDAIRAQVELSALDGELATLEAERHGQVARLNALIDRDPDAPMADPAEPPALPEVDHARHQALAGRLKQRNPAVFAERARVAGAERSRDVVLDNRRPDFKLGLGAVQMGSRVAEWELMLEVNIPLQQDTRRSQEREAAAMLSAAKARQRSAEVQLAGELAHAVIDYEAARKLERLATQNLLPQAELSFAAALAAYENGKVDFATLLDAQRQIRQARLTQLKARADALVRRAEIEYAVGEPL